MQGRAVMRRVMTLCGLVVVFALGTDAQVRPQNSLFLGSSFPAIAAAFPSAGPAAIPAPTPEPAPADPQGIYGVIQNFNFQISGGFTYMRFYEIPNTTGDLDGFNISLVYYPRGGHWGVDGEFVAAFAPQNGVTTTLDRRRPTGAKAPWLARQEPGLTWRRPTGEPPFGSRPTRSEPTSSGPIR